MLYRPPLYTLFPYTTLFRSTVEVSLDLSIDLRSCGYVNETGKKVLCSGYGNKLLSDICLLDVGEHETKTNEVDGGNKDRKSTRLNSSHVKISYAVFCLKKKK